MNAQTAIDLTRDALWISLLVGAPVLVAGLIVGLFIGLMQALTQIQEQTVSFVPKLIAMAIVLALASPWLIDQLVEYSRQLIAHIPNNL